jgi:hypothetical protein
MSCGNVIGLGLDDGESAKYNVIDLRAPSAVAPETL